jgi:circadian clock protein KaiB
MINLKLYTTGRTPRSRKMINELEEMFERNCGGQYALEVIDVFEDPESAHDDAVFATPTLVRSLPEPVRRIVGDLSSEERVLAGLEIEKQ